MVSIAPFADHPDVVIKWVFYPVPKTNPMLPYATVFGPLTWEEKDTNDWQRGDGPDFPFTPGTVPYSEEPYYGPWPEPVVGELVGTEDEWLHGLDYQRWIIDGYDNPNGCFPLGAKLFMDGDLEFGGYAEVELGPNVGGMEFGGTGLVVPEEPLAFTGGLELGGTGLVIPEAPLTFTGGLELGGTGLVVPEEPLAFTGGLELSGSGAVVPEEPLAFTGGLELGGTGLVIPEAPLTFTGGLELGGTGLVVPEEPLAFTGGLELGGTGLVVAPTEDGVLLYSADLSNQATIPITGITGYSWYLLQVYNLRARAGGGADLWMRTSGNGGSSYDSGGSDYADSNGFSAGSKIVLKTGIPDTSLTSHNCGLTMQLYDLDGTSLYKVVNWQFGAVSGTIPVVANGSGFRLATAKVDALQLLCSTGNIDASVRLYGYT